MTTITESRHFTVYSQRLAGHLMLNGFILRVLVTDYNHSHYNKFLFDNTPELQRAIHEWDEKRHKITK